MPIISDLDGRVAQRERCGRDAVALVAEQDDRALARGGQVAEPDRSA